MDATLTAAAIGAGGAVIVGLAGFWANVRNTNKTAAYADTHLGRVEASPGLAGWYALMACGVGIVPPLTG
jgi:hypothetical protein